MKPLVEEYGKANDRLEALNKKLPDELKASVLQEALRGRLTTQLPSDGDAQSLIDQIEAEKAKSSAKNKKYIPPQPVNPDDAPFLIPDNWKWVRLGVIFDMKAGKAISASELSAVSDATHQYPCYGGNGIRGYIGKYSNDGKYCIIGRQGALCGNVKIAEGQFYATEHAVVVYQSDCINTDWAYFFLGIANLNQYATSTAQPGLSVNTILQTLLPLPPLAEQQRIVDKIEEVFALIDNLRV